MLQAIMTKPGEIQFNEIDTPIPKPKEVLLKIRKIGVCGSDIHVYHGLHPYTPFPVVQGHEVSGEIVSCGQNASKYDLGQLVTFMPQITCGTCYQCKHGDYHICENLKVMGFQTGGAAQEYFIVPEENIIPFSNNITLEIGAMIEPISVAVHAIRRSAMNIKGKNVLVLGAGPIGNLTAQVANALGATVMITDVSDYRLEKAKECGIGTTVNPMNQDLTSEIQNTFGEGKADLILECVGIQQTMDDAIENARKGTAIIIVGVFGKKPTVDMGLIQDRELSLIGTLMYKKEDYLDAVALCENKELCLEPMITDRFEFSDYLSAYHYIEKAKDKTLKVMINL
jgi:L-iditol 2-dehydrogenase